MTTRVRAKATQRFPCPILAFAAGDRPTPSSFSRWLLDADAHHGCSRETARPRVGVANCPCRPGRVGQVECAHRLLPSARGHSEAQRRSCTIGLAYFRDARSLGWTRLIRTAPPLSPSCVVREVCVHARRLRDRLERSNITAAPPWRLVILERGFLDLAVDPARCGLRPRDLSCADLRWSSARQPSSSRQSHQSSRREAGAPAR